MWYKNGEIISDPNNFFSLPDNKIDEGSDDYIDVAGENTLFRFEEYDFLRLNINKF